MVGRAGGVVRRVGWTRLLLISALLGLMAFGTFANFGREQAAAAAPVTAAAAAPSPVLTGEPSSGAAYLVDQDSPGQVAANIRSGKTDASSLDACEFLSFCRWHGATNTSNPGFSLTNGTSTLNTILSSFASLCFQFCAFVLYLLGLVLLLTAGLDVIDKVVFTIDHLYATFSADVLGMKGGSFLSTNTIFGGITLLGFMILLLIGMGIWRVIKERSMTGFTIGHPGIRSIGGGLMVVVILSMLANQAVKNHADLERGGGLSKVGQSAAGQTGTAGKPVTPGSIANSPPTGVTSNYANWSVFSPGWFVALGHQVSGLLTNAAGNYTAAIASAGESLVGGGAKGSECDRYQAAMERAFTDTQAYRSVSGAGVSAKNPGVLIQFSRLYEQTYMKMYTYGALGGSPGAQQRAWCRTAEAQTGQDTGQQLMLSRMAGLYSEAIGTGSLNMIPGGQLEGGVNGDLVAGTASDGYLVLANGQWNPKPPVAYSETQAKWLKIFANPFGPTTQRNSLSSALEAQGFVGPKQLGGTGPLYYFAACQWATAGSKAELNPDWANVYHASDAGDTKVLLTTKDCLMGYYAILGGVGSGSAVQWNYYQKDQSLINKGLRGLTSSVPLIGGLITPDKDSHDDAAAFQYAGGNTGSPQEYYAITQGIDVGPVLVMGLVCILIAYMLVKMLGPIIVGALLVQFLAAGMLLVLIFLSPLLVLPLRKPREMAASVGQTVVASMLVGALLTVLFGILFAIIDVFLGIFDSVYNGPNGLLVALRVAGSYIGGMWVARTLIARLFGSGMLTGSGGINIPLKMAASRLTDTGMPSPLSRAFWSGGANDDTRGVRRTAKGLRNRFGRSDTEDATRKAHERKLTEDATSAKGREIGPKDRDGKPIAAGLVGADLRPGGASRNTAGKDVPWKRAGTVGANGKSFATTGQVTPQEEEKRQRVENLLNNLIGGRPNPSPREGGVRTDFPGVQGTRTPSRLGMNAQRAELLGNSPRIPGQPVESVTRAATAASMLSSGDGLFLPDSAVRGIREAAASGSALGTADGIERLAQWVPVDGGRLNMVTGPDGQQTLAPPGIQTATIIPGMGERHDRPVLIGDITIPEGQMNLPTPPMLHLQMPDVIHGAGAQMFSPADVMRGQQIQMEHIQGQLMQQHGAGMNNPLPAESWNTWADLRDWSSSHPAPVVMGEWPGERRRQLDSIVDDIADHYPAVRATRGSRSVVRNSIEGIINRIQQTRRDAGR